MDQLLDAEKGLVGINVNYCRRTVGSSRSSIDKIVNLGDSVSDAEQIALAHKKILLYLSSKY